MPDLFEWVSSNGSYSNNDSFVYKTVMKYVLNDDQGKSIALRLLLHYYGDIHQPLHCASRYTLDQFPDGDRGGNEFKLKNHYKASNLHALWDSVIYTYRKTIYRPFTEKSWSEFGIISEALSDEFPYFEDIEVQTLDFK
jgi:hypothetical protein